MKNQPTPPNDHIHDAIARWYEEHQTQQEHERAILNDALWAIACQKMINDVETHLKDQSHHPHETEQ